MYYDVVVSIYDESGKNDIRIDSYLICGGFKTEDEAMDYINKALRCWGDEANQNPFTLRNLGEIYYELGDMERSIDYLRKAYNLEGDEIFHSDGYGKIDHNKYFKIYM